MAKIYQDGTIQTSGKVKKKYKLKESINYDKYFDNLSKIDHSSTEEKRYYRDDEDKLFEFSKSEVTDGNVYLNDLKLSWESLSINPPKIKSKEEKFSENWKRIFE